MIPRFQSPPTSARTATPSSTEQSMMLSSSECFCCQHRTQAAVNESPLYNYPSGMSHTPVTNMGLGISPPCSTSTVPAGFHTAIDQHLRSVLRPEAFLSPFPAQEQVTPAFWNSSVGANLSQVNASAFDGPTSYPAWTSAPETMPNSVRAAQQLSGTPPHSESQ